MRCSPRSCQGWSHQPRPHTPACTRQVALHARCQKAPVEGHSQPNQPRICFKRPKRGVIPHSRVPGATPGGCSGNTRVRKRSCIRRGRALQGARGHEPACTPLARHVHGAELGKTRLRTASVSDGRALVQCVHVHMAVVLRGSEGPQLRLSDHAHHIAGVSTRQVTTKVIPRPEVHSCI